jgi:hypothetical protein
MRVALVSFAFVLACGAASQPSVRPSPPSEPTPVAVDVDQDCEAMVSGWLWSETGVLLFGQQPPPEAFDHEDEEADDANAPWDRPTVLPVATNEHGQRRAFGSIATSRSGSSSQP